MRKLAFYIILLTLNLTYVSVYAADLIEVYQQALSCDPTFKKAIAQRFSTQEGVPLTIAQLLPNVTFTGETSVVRTAYAGAAFQTNTTTGIPLSPRNNTARGATITLTATQTIFDFAQFMAVAGQLAVYKQADAILNQALQDLIVRVAKAYFTILQDEDNLYFAEAAKNAYGQQLIQVREQHRAGLKSVTDVYTAKAAYESSVSNYYTARAILANDRFKLRAITGKYYAHLEPLGESFPLIEPNPTCEQAWVEITLCQNWAIKAAQYNLTAKRQLVRQYFSGHLPTVSAQGLLDRQYVNNINGYNPLTSRNGPAAQTDRSLSLNVNFPIFAGGAVVAQTNQAIYDYEVAQENLEYIIREAVMLASQSYVSIVIAIDQIEADKLAIAANVKSVEGMEVTYKAGTTTLIDVLNQLQRLYQAQTKYATDLYSYVNNFFQLKFAAGILNFDDLRAVNCWLKGETQFNRPLTRKFIYSNKTKSTQPQMLADGTKRVKHKN